jgi:hypothetical protein
MTEYRVYSTCGGQKQRTGFGFVMKETSIYKIRGCEAAIVYIPILIQFKVITKATDAYDAFS